MAHPFQITVKQTITELRRLQRSHGELIGKRLLMLIEINRHEKRVFLNVIFPVLLALIITVSLSGVKSITTMALSRC